MKRLFEEPLETAQAAPHVREDARYKTDGIQSYGLGKTLAERYAEGEMVLHLHARIRSGDLDGELADFCAIYEGSVDRVTVRERGVFQSEDFDSRLQQSRPDDIQTAVFVHDVEVVDYREGIEGRVLPVTVRLQCFDFGPRFFG